MARYAPPLRAPDAKKAATAETPRPRAAPPSHARHVAGAAAARRRAAGGVVQLRAAPEKPGLIERAANGAASLFRPPAKAPNRTGLPDRLKGGVEALSGLAMDDVRVHRNSPEPARLGALAYTQGTDIHLGPGQEQHLPHEAWHVVQQKQGRVAATTQMKGLRVNEAQDLENEADRMSAGLNASRFADAAVETMASGEETLAFPKGMSNPTASSAHPIQLQKQAKKPPKDIMFELSMQAFQKHLQKQKLNEEINGGAAKALASAYLSAQVPAISQVSMNSVTTYNVTPVQDVAWPPKFEEVYTAILSLMDIASTKDWQNAAAWKWTPAPKESGTRREAIVETADWAGEEAVGYATDEARDSAIRRVAGKAADSTIDKIRDKLLKDME